MLEFSDLLAFACIFGWPIALFALWYFNDALVGVLGGPTRWKHKTSLPTEADDSWKDNLVN